MLVSGVPLYAGPAHCKLSEIIMRGTAKFNMSHSEQRVGVDKGVCAQVAVYRGTSPIRKRPPPCDPPKTLGIGLR